MKCSDYKKLISRFIDSDVTDDEATEIEKHITGCSKCKEIYTDYLRIGQLLEVSYSGNYNNTPLKSTSTQSQRSFLRPSWSFSIAATILLTLSLTVAIAIFSNNRKNRELKYVIGEEMQYIMNSPLGTLAYYEYFCGKSIQNQLSNVNTDKYLNTYTQHSNTKLNYQSPLFNDTAAMDYRNQLAYSYLY